MTKVAENIKTLRQRKNLTQKQLGALCARSDGQIADYEKGRVDIPASVIYAIAENTGTDITWLMTGEEPENQKYDAVFRVYREEDRKTIVPILVANGYDVGQHKRQRTKTGKTVDYFIHITESEMNIESSRG